MNRYTKMNTKTSVWHMSHGHIWPSQETCCSYHDFITEHGRQCIMVTKEGDHQIMQGTNIAGEMKACSNYASIAEAQ